MPIGTGIRCAIVAQNSQEAIDEDKYIKEIFGIDYINPELKRNFKNLKKRQYINNFIDEIPDLSYYEAKQLRKKLGNIYVEWNDE